MLPIAAGETAGFYIATINTIIIISATKTIHTNREVVKKNRYSTVRLTVSVDPPLPLRSAFLLIFLCVFFILDCDYVCSETAFTREKSHFHPTS